MSKRFFHARKDLRHQFGKHHLLPLLSNWEARHKFFFTFSIPCLEGLLHSQNVNLECRLHQRHQQNPTKWDICPSLVPGLDFILVQDRSNVELVTLFDGFNQYLGPIWFLQEKTSNNYFKGGSIVWVHSPQWLVSTMGGIVLEAIEKSSIRGTNILILQQNYEN